MSSCVVEDAAEQLCYIPCNFCNIVLAVSVPCKNMFEIVTVRCGHCSNLWSVNMAAAAFNSLNHHHHHHHPPPQPQPQPQDFLQAPNYNNINIEDYRMENMDNYTKYKNINKTPYMRPSLAPIHHTNSIQRRVANPPPEKKQRVPSAYNQFIKEEIQRIKANNPEISHREAFSTAAKNWAHFPHIHFGLMLDNSRQATKLDEGFQPRTALLNN